VVGRDGLHQLPGRDPYSTLVYASAPEDVQYTLVDGQLLVDGGAVRDLDRAELAAAAGQAAAQLIERAKFV
jgi:cytosine/adenosine deaminase-related metal-dependent hydrolase